MLSLQNLPIEWLLIGARATGLLIGFICLAWALMRWRRAAQRDTQRIFEQMDIALTDIRALAELTTSLAARVEALSQRMDNASRAAPPPATPGVRGYEIATRMARSGSNAEELVKSCGLTRHEAELVMRLHGMNVAPIATDSRKEFPTAKPQAAPPAPLTAGSAERTRTPGDIAVRMAGLQPQATALNAQPPVQPRKSRLSVVVG